MYSAAVVAAVTLALSYAVYSLASFHVSPEPVYSTASFSIFGSPSFLHLTVNSTAPAFPLELRIDRTSSLSGILEATASGYSNTQYLCTPAATTFFSVQTTAGTLSVSGSGTTWIDGAETVSAAVQQGWHEVVISDGSACTVTLPGGTLLSAPAASVSSIPVATIAPQSLLFLIPYYSTGHVARIVFDGGTEAVGF